MDPRSVVPGRGANARILFVGDFAASRFGNYSVAEDLSSRLEDVEFDVARTSSRSHRLVRVAAMVARASTLPDIDVAVVDVYSGRAFFWAEMVCSVLHARRTPHVLVLRGGNLPAFARRHPRRVARLLRRADVVVALSEYLGDKLAPYAERLVVIPNPLDVSRYEFRERTRPEPRLMWLRSFHDIYNPTLAPRVLARLAVDEPEARLVMIGADKGDGSLAETRRTAQRLGVLERIEFAGPVAKADVAARLQDGDVYLNTSRIDNVPISVLEAMACGLCVVSTSVGGIPYLVHNETNALIVADDDHEAMAAAVTRCLTEPGLAGSISRQGRRLAESFDWDEVLPRWARLLRSTVSDEAR